MRSQRLSRRVFVKRLGRVLAAVGLCTACAPLGPAASGGGPGASSLATVAPGQARQGGRLVYARNAAIQSTNPYPLTPSTLGFRRAIFNSLVGVDSRAQPMPELAESWALSDDRLTLTLRLRDGVTFHSGRRFTAEDAKWSIEYVQDPTSGSQMAPSLKGVQARALDATTLELRLPEVLPHVFSLLADVLILDAESKITTNAGGTGPFKLDSFQPGNDMQLVRNTAYWRPNRPFVDAATVRSMPDPAAGVVALESGAVNLLQCPPNEVQRLKASNSTAVTVLPSTGSYALLLNAAEPPFSDRRVRQAIDLALDRPRFSQTLLYGLGDPTYGIWARSSPAWEASQGVGELDLDKARQLLGEAGYPNGFATRIQGSTSYPPLNQFLQIVQADLAKINVSAAVEVLEAAQASALIQQGRFATIIAASYTYADLDPAMLFTSVVFRPTDNSSRFESREYRQMVDDARREPDWDRRMGLYRRIAAFVKDQAFVLPLAEVVAAWAHASSVHGISKEPTTPTPALEHIWLT